MVKNMSMSIPIKFQVDIDIVAEGRRWERLVMLCDGSLYGIQREQYSNDIDLHPINRTFAGQLLKEKKKREIAKLNKIQENHNNLQKEVKMFQRRISELVGQKSKSAFNERLERRETINQLKKKLENHDPSVKCQKDVVAHIERCIQKFKGISKPHAQSRTKPSKTQRAKTRKPRTKKPSPGQNP